MLVTVSLLLCGWSHVVMTNRLIRLLPAICGLYLIAFTIIEIVQGKVYPTKGAPVIVETEHPIEFWISICLEGGGGIFLIFIAWYGLRRKAKK